MICHTHGMCCEQSYTEGWNFQPDIEDVLVVELPAKQRCMASYILSELIKDFSVYKDISGLECPTCGDRSYKGYNVEFPNGMPDVGIFQVKRLEQNGKRMEAVIAIGFVFFVRGSTA